MLGHSGTQRLMSHFQKRTKRPLLEPNHIRGYINADEVVPAAAMAGMSVGNYVEQVWDEVGRSSSINSKLCHYLAVNPQKIVEIGAGTGRYVGDFLSRYSPDCVHIFEPDAKWAKYLADVFGDVAICHPADGFSLNGLADSSVDLVAAHGVFVYLPYATVWAYLREIERVLVPGGIAWFDVYADVGFESVEAWYADQSLWPVVYPIELIHQMVKTRGLLDVKAAFAVPHGKSTATYLIVQKIKSVGPS